MPVDMTRYPSNWKQISKDRRAQADQRCEWCGVPNHAFVVRKPGTAEYLLQHMDADVTYRWPDGTPIRLSELPDGFDYDKTTRIVLTVAHLGVDYPDGRKGDKRDKMDVRPENLAALCQRCHLVFDKDEHAENARVTRLRKKRAAIARTGQKALFAEGDTP